MLNTPLVHLLGLAAYLAACLAWIYGPVSNEPGSASNWWLPALVLLQVAFGALVGKWWAFLVPLVLVPVSLPAGYGDYGELPVWVGVMFLAALSMPLVAFGVFTRKLVDHVIANKHGLQRTHG